MIKEAVKEKVLASYPSGGGMTHIVSGFEYETAEEVALAWDRIEDIILADYNANLLRE